MALLWGGAGETGCAGLTRGALCRGQLIEWPLLQKWGRMNRPTLVPLILGGRGGNGPADSLLVPLFVGGREGRGPADSLETFLCCIDDVGFWPGTSAFSRIALLWGGVGETERAGLTRGALCRGQFIEWPLLQKWGRVNR